MPKRSINHSYQDPVDLIWLRAAADLGLTVQRSRDAYAAYDGQGHLTISVPDEFDPDDSLAQMIFHELCHWLVSGPGARDLPDWGLSNTSRRDLVYEYACHRLQAALAAPYGLREFMAVTTVWRSYWNALPENPLQDGEDPAIAIAQAGFRLARTSPFQEVLSRSLAATAVIADAVRGV
ncbi:MAG: YkgJ family cysteine cluster protein, partial [Planctomyces sp.]